MKTITKDIVSLAAVTVFGSTALLCAVLYATPEGVVSETKLSHTSKDVGPIHESWNKFPRETNILQEIPPVENEA